MPRKAGNVNLECPISSQEGVQAVTLDSIKAAMNTSESTEGNAHSCQHMKPVSYMNTMRPNATKLKVNFHELQSNVLKDADLMLVFPGLRWRRLIRG